MPIWQQVQSPSTKCIKHNLIIIMEQQRALSPLDLFLKCPVKVQHKTQQGPREVVCLSGQKCVVMFKTFCLVIDLHQGETQKEVEVDFTGKGRIFNLTPVGEGFFCTSDLYQEGADESYFHFVDKQLKMSSFKIRRQQTVWLDVTVFPLTSHAYINDSGWSNISLMDLSTMKYITNLKITRCLKANDSNLLILERTESKLVCFDILTSTQSEIVLPPSIQKQMVYVVDENHGLYTRDHPHIVQFGVATFGEQGNWMSVMLFPEYDLVNFELMNPNLSMVMIRLRQQSCSKKPKQLNKYLVIDYVQQKVVSQHTMTDNSCNFTIHMSPTFDHYMFIEKIPGDQASGTVINHKKTNTKRLYMHLFMESGIADLYGLNMFRLILQAL